LFTRHAFPVRKEPLGRPIAIVIAVALPIVLTERSQIMLTAIGVEPAMKLVFVLNATLALRDAPADRRGKPRSDAFDDTGNALSDAFDLTPLTLRDHRHR